MSQVLIIADDLTGALDASVNFLPADVAVVTSADGVNADDLASGASVLSVNAASRHLDAKDSACVVGELVSRAVSADVPLILKKTDSVLRGNVGAELAATLKASGLPRIHFLPSFPQMGRITNHGIHCVDGTPVASSFLGDDPFDPVACSDVRKLLALQTDVPVRVIGVNEKVPLDFEGIVVYDATTDEQMLHRVRELMEHGELRLVAGCAGVTQAISRVIDIPASTPPRPNDKSNLLVVCGSVNKVSHDQCGYAESHGAPVFHIAEVEKCDASWQKSEPGLKFIDSVEDSWSSSPLTVIDGSDLEELSGFLPAGTNIPELVASNVGSLLASICKKGVCGRALVTGGDVLASFLRQTGVKRMRPLGQLAPGIVGFESVVFGTSLVIASKSGGFGSKDLFCEMASIAR